MNLLRQPIVNEYDSQRGTAYLRTGTVLIARHTVPCNLRCALLNAETLG